MEDNLMSRKMLLPIFVAIAITLIAGLLVSTVALAQDGTPPKAEPGKEGLGQRMGQLLDKFRRNRMVMGNVTAVGADEFSIEKQDGSQVTFKVDDKTRFFGLQGADTKERTELTFANMKLGSWVTVAPDRRSKDVPLARGVTILPADFDPSQFEAVRGRVAAIDLNANRFTIEKREGEMQQVTVDSDTIYRGQVAELADLEEGMLVGVVSKETTGDEFIAKIVKANQVGQRFVGEVGEVNAAAGTFTLTPKRTGEKLTIAVDEKTRFISKDKKVTGLDDLKPGMIAAVATAQSTESGAALLAKTVAAGEKREQPKFDLRTTGRITALDSDQITIENRKGETLVFAVGADSKVVKGRNQPASYADLKVGMAVIVGANELEGGSMQAQVIVIMPNKSSSI